MKIMIMSVICGLIMSATWILGSAYSERLFDDPLPENTTMSVYKYIEFED